MRYKSQIVVRSNTHRFRIRADAVVFSFLIMALTCPSKAKSPTFDKTGKVASTRRTETVTERLYAEDATVARVAIDELARQRRGKAASVLEAFLRYGQPDELTDYALKTLVALRDPSAKGLLIEFSRHRRPAARLSAYQGLAAIGSTSAVSQGLSDSDAAVRAAAALALVKLDARAELPRLFTALERGVPEAAAAIGTWGDDASARRFTGYIQHLPLSVMLSGFRIFLSRVDISEEPKLDIVTALGEKSVRDAKQFLREISACSAIKKLPRLRKAIAVTIARIKEPAASSANRPFAGGAP